MPTSENRPLARPHRLGDLLCLAGHELSHFDVVFLPIEGHAQKRLAEYIAIGGIEIEVIVAVGHDRAVGLDVDGI